MSSWENISIGLGKLLLLAKPPRRSRRRVMLITKRANILFVVFQAVDFRIHENLRAADFSDIGKYSTPPLALLSLLKKSMKDRPHYVVYVDLTDVCIPDWSAASKKRRERIEKMNKIDPEAKKALVAANIAAGGNGTFLGNEDNPLTMSNWHYYMGLYVLAVSVVGGEISNTRMHSTVATIN
jgi:hypothetical protein